MPKKSAKSKCYCDTSINKIFLIIVSALSALFVAYTFFQFLFRPNSYSEMYPLDQAVHYQK